MLYRTLGKSGLNVSVIAFGAWQIGDPEFWGDDPQADPDGVVGAAIDAGINLFDTAELYGNGRSEEVLGKALQGRREQVFIASKAATQHCNADDLREACENSLRRLGTDRIDLYQVHWPLPHRFNEAIIPILERLRIEGKIREIGVSNFGPQDIEAWMGSGTAVSDQIGYNLLFRAPEYEMIPACRRHHLGVLAYMPLMQGLLSGRYPDLDSIPMKRRRSRHFSGVREGTRHDEEGYERVLKATLEALLDFSEAIHIPLATVSLAWLISQPGVTSAILGARNVAQLRSNVTAVDLNIGPAAIALLNEYSYELKAVMGYNCDMWETEANKRIH